MNKLFFLITKFPKVKFILTLGIIQGFTYDLKAQLPLYSQYTFNAFLLNPAVAGAEGYDALNITSREQRIGIQNVSNIYALSYQTRIMKTSNTDNNASVKRRYHLRSGRVGLGMYLYNGHIGQKSQTGAQFTYAYHITKCKSRLSFGWTFSILQGVPDINAGVYYSDQNKFFGLSILQITDASINKSNYDDWYRFYFTGGYQFSLNDKNILEPSFFFKFSENLKRQVDATLKYSYKRKFWLGLGYRSGTTIIGSVGLNINRFHIGYAYDYCPHGGITEPLDSQEFMIALKLGDNARRYKWVERY